MQVIYRGNRYQVLHTTGSIKNGSAEYLIKGDKLLVVPAGECLKVKEPDDQSAPGQRCPCVP